LLKEWTSFFNALYGGGGAMFVNFDFGIAQHFLNKVRGGGIL
jgi:hypothetical protein